MSEKVDHRVLKSGLNSESESVLIPRIVAEKVLVKNQDRPETQPGQSPESCQIHPELNMGRPDGPV